MKSSSFVGIVYSLSFVAQPVETGGNHRHCYRFLVPPSTIKAEKIYVITMKESSGKTVFGADANTRNNLLLQTR
ncbi:hypothetical protein HNR37_000518 [Desulfurispira natronophila]|uniref:Uncharacterized protein n=1 Tax=Desulfurispira natronophila TaxID=682562 RepID=A0A7W8DGA8_9BACT|nr:hypothetical protein [Desulfurispira natronophila]